jgi:Ca2+-binding EF-hand superfamily protein
MKTAQKVLLSSAFLLVMSIADARAQGLFFGFMSVQTPVIYNEHQVRDVTEHQAQDMFHAMDTNKDGFVSRAEFNTAYSGYFPDDPLKARMEKRFRTIDKSSFEDVSEAEFIANRNITIDDSFKALASNDRN